MQVKEAWEVLGLDLIGPLPETARNKKYVLTMTDLYTKWVIAEPMQSKTATEVSAIITAKLYLFGMVRKIITDQGKEFVNEVKFCIVLIVFSPSTLVSTYIIIYNYSTIANLTDDLPAAKQQHFQHAENQTCCLQCIPSPDQRTGNSLDICPVRSIVVLWLFINLINALICTG